jgi:hypothetical protein
VFRIEVIDSFGKVPAGLLQGTSADLGDFQECQDVTYESPSTSSTSNELFLGKYCLLTLKPLLPPQPRQLFVQQPLLNLTGSLLQNTVSTL